MSTARRFFAGLALLTALVGAAGAETLRGGGRISALNTPPGTVRVDDTPLAMDRGTQVLDFGGQPTNAAALEVGMSVSYTADAPTKPGQLPALRQIRMVPN